MSTATDIELQQAINRLLRDMHLYAVHYLYAVIDDNDELWLTPEGRVACSICGHHL